MIKAQLLFKIGPVTFYPRHEWIKTLDHKIAAIVEDVWSRRLSVDQLWHRVISSTACRKFLLQAHYAVTTIGPHLWVGTARIADYDHMQSARKGTVLAS